MYDEPNSLGSMVAQGFATTALTVGLASVVGYGLYKIITVKGAASTPSDYGRKWLAWMVFISTAGYLSGFLRHQDVDSFAKWVIIVVFFGAVGFAIGWIYGKLFMIKEKVIHGSIEIKPSAEDTSHKKSKKKRRVELDKSNLHKDTIGTKSDAPMNKSEGVDYEPDSRDSNPRMKSERYNRESYKNAFLAIEYRPEAKAAFDSLSDVPIKFKLKFMALLEENPKGSVEEYLVEIRKEYNSWLNPYVKRDMNLAYREVRKLGNEAEKEFKEIVDVLGDSVEPKEIIKKIIEKYSKKIRRMDPSDILEILQQKYKMSTSQLMVKLGVNYGFCNYVFKGKKYDKFADALIAAEEDALGLSKQDSSDVNNLFDSDRGKIINEQQSTPYRRVREPINKQN